MYNNKEYTWKVCVHFAAFTGCLNMYMFSNIPEVCLIPVKPSLVATACIAAARQKLQLCPKWTGILQNVTGYQFMDLLPCVSVLIR